MKGINKFLVVLGCLIALIGCKEEEILEEVFETNTVITTRFMNSDSISVLTSLLSDLSKEISALNNVVDSSQTVIDSLNTRIAEDPENSNVMLWEEQISKLDAVKEQTNLNLEPLAVQNSMFTNKRDSLNQGYSNILEIQNLSSGTNVVLDTVLTTYLLPLDFGRNETTYRIVVGDEVSDITINYLLDEELSLDGKLRLRINELSIIENGFDSLTITDEDIYIFHY